MNASDAWRLFWAKTFPRDGEDRTETDRLHPLWAHLIDVANVADLLWEHRVPPALRHRMAGTLGLPLSDARRWLSLWIGLHDVGKAIPGFQVLSPFGWELLGTAGLPLVNVTAEHRKHHGHATIPMLFQHAEAAGIPKPATALVREVSAFVGFHHGWLLPNAFLLDWDGNIDEWKVEEQGVDFLSDDTWQEAQQALVENVRRAWLDEEDLWPRPEEMPDGPPDWLLAVAGWATWADWIGSMSEHFPGYPDGVAPSMDLQAYKAESRSAAETALRSVGIGNEAVLQTSTFGCLFPFDESDIRPLQAATRSLSLGDEPTLTIIEGPTGEGKTEGAFLLAARQQKGRPEGGIYTGMPTQATSNALYPRLVDFLERGCSATHTANTVLLHGGADLHPSRSPELNSDTPAPTGVSDEDGDAPQDDRADVRTRQWFLPRKRGLLASFGVGTVDQAFLGVLYSRHFFLRLFGLAGKTVIFDEVHAYDTYMNRLFDKLLEWLRAMGTHVILLSATLPAQTRRRLLRTWESEDGAAERFESDEEAPYPVIWHTASNGPVTFETRCRCGSRKTCSRDESCQRPPIKVQQLVPNRKEDSDSTRKKCYEPIASCVREALDEGATIAVIVNTVRRAQSIYKALRPFNDLSNGDLSNEDHWLLHARLPHGLRSKREEAVTRRFGEERRIDRPEPAVLVATQVAEQSLDLDVDVMISDLAPIDLLLQRAGRMHRFDLPVRPPGYETPTLHVVYPEADEGDLPELNDYGLGHVYDRFDLYRTWHVLEKEDDWNLPGDYRMLIEGVYGDDEGPPEVLSEAAEQTWTEARRERGQDERVEEGEAEERVIPSPTALEDMLRYKQQILADDEDINVHADRRALTRLGGPSIQAVCLHRDPVNGELYLDPEHARKAPFDALAHRDTRLHATRALLEQSVRISRETLVHHLVDMEVPRWEDAVESVAALAWHRPLIFTHRLWAGHEHLRVRFDDDLGLKIWDVRWEKEP
jgi:CRISPR-associated endonuclease/helicase Cas3